MQVRYCIIYERCHKMTQTLQKEVCRAGFRHDSNKHAPNHTLWEQMKNEKAPQGHEPGWLGESGMRSLPLPTHQQVFQKDSYSGPYFIPNFLCVLVLAIPDCKGGRGNMPDHLHLWDKPDGRSLATLLWFWPCLLGIRCSRNRQSFFHLCVKEKAPPAQILHAAEDIAARLREGRKWADPCSTSQLSNPPPQSILELSSSTKSSTVTFLNLGHPWPY